MDRVLLLTRQGRLELWNLTTESSAVQGTVQRHRHRLEQGATFQETRGGLWLDRGAGSKNLSTRHPADVPPQRAQEGLRSNARPCEDAGAETQAHDIPLQGEQVHTVQGPPPHFSDVLQAVEQGAVSSSPLVLHLLQISREESAETSLVCRSDSA